MPGLAALRSLKNATRVLPNQQLQQVEFVPPPIGGWNRRDTLPLMDPKDAIILDNFIPDTNSVNLRPGYSVHATIAATATAVETLIQYTPQTVSNRKLFAAIPTAIYDVTAEATASSTAAVVTSLTNGRWYGDQMTNSGGHYLMIANGADNARIYDGSSWANTSITGPTATSLIGFHNHKNRMWMWEENSLKVWYLGTSAISGTATNFFPSLKKGGKIMAVGSWTRDGGSGSDDFLVFVTNRGECAIYSGFSPGSAESWQLVGTYNIPDVIGRRCLINAGAELGILTMQGLVPLSQVLGLSPGGAARSTFTDKISGYFRAQYFESGTLFGWEAVEYPRGNLLIVNIPLTERSVQHQAVMNIYTGAWCRFKSINAGCWALLGDNIYFGGNNGIVYKFGGDHSDNGSGIIATVKHSYNTFGSPQRKRFSMARPILSSPSGYSPPVTIQTDYDDSDPSVELVAASTGGTQWDTAQWDSFQWAGGTVPSLSWQGTTGEGRAGAVAFAVSSPEEIIYNGCDVGFERGSTL